MFNESEVKALVAEILEKEVTEIPDDASFVTDLGMDSLRALEILAMLEKRYKIRIPSEKLRQMVNMKGVLAVLNEYTGG
jgi:acyl carrier protein